MCLPSLSLSSPHQRVRQHSPHPFCASGSFSPTTPALNSDSEADDHSSDSLSDTTLGIGVPNELDALPAFLQPYFPRETQRRAEEG